MDSGPPRTRDTYVIVIAGQLSTKRAAWLDGVSVTPFAEGFTVLTAPESDQAALYGLLTRLRDLGLKLLALARLDTQMEEDHGRR